MKIQKRDLHDIKHSTAPVTRSKRPLNQVHENGVVLLAALPLESFLFTAAYDGKLKAFDALSAQLIFEAANPSACREAQLGPPRHREHEHNC